MKFETIHARSLALAIAADAVTPAYHEAEIAGLTIHESPCFERRPPARGNISRMIGQAKQECLRALRISYEEGDIGFEELLSLYEVVNETARELAWERWLAMNPDPCSYREPEQIDVPVREDWQGYEDHGFQAIVPVGDVLAFGGVA